MKEEPCREGGCCHSALFHIQCNEEDGGEKITMQERTKNPFVFRVSQEALRDFKDASAEAGLNWLEEANRFVADFVPPQELEKWKKISKQ